ncbi:hypothetical protein HUU39_18080 [candidate division KSB1 bacterium]|nr:hypothetical protein [bacterium]NUM67150.1 hypothetical protein [candidate division KSB1 bacterium]
MRFSSQLKTLFLLLLAAGFTACQQNVGPEDHGMTADLNSADFAVAGFDDFLANVSAVTLDQEMACAPVFPGGRFHRKPDRPFGPGAHLGKILRELGASREQMEQVRVLLTAHRECAQEPLENLRAANQELIDAANAQRREIMQAVRNGELTRAQAQERLQAINDSTQQAIASNPANAPYLQALCVCRMTLFGGVRGLLDAAQQAVWDEWVAGLPEDGCR